MWCLPPRCPERWRGRPPTVEPTRTLVARFVPGTRAPCARWARWAPPARRTARPPSARLTGLVRSAIDTLDGTLRQIRTIILDLDTSGLLVLILIAGLVFSQFQRPGAGDHVPRPDAERTLADR